MTPTQSALEEFLNVWAPHLSAPSNLLKRPEIRYLDLVIARESERQEAEQVEIQIKYEGYIQKAIEKSKKSKPWKKNVFPEDIDYDAILTY